MRIVMLKSDVVAFAWKPSIGVEVPNPAALSA